MATGVYGTVRCADVLPSDIEVFYVYQEDSVSPSTQPIQLDSNLLIKKDNPNNVNEILGGLYDFKLPSSIFNKKGIYTILIRPRRIRTRILDCGILSNDPTIRGLVIDTGILNPSDKSLFENNNLIGYRIEYLDTSNVFEKKVVNTFRIVTSNMKVEPISETLSNVNTKAVRYRSNENSSLSFLTVTPSLNTNLNPNQLPFLGNPNQEILICNTYFTPISLKVNMVEHDADTLAIGIFGDQTFNVSNGKRTYYNTDGTIYKQFDEFVIKNELNDEKLYEVKEESENVDFSENIDDISNR